MTVSTANLEALNLRCYAERDGALWVALCVDLSLAAQGDTSDEARHNLIDQITEYLYDVLAGEDQIFSDILWTRKAPWQQVLKYHHLKTRNRLHLSNDSDYSVFSHTFSNRDVRVLKLCDTPVLRSRLYYRLDARRPEN